MYSPRERKDRLERAANERAVYLEALNSIWEFREQFDKTLNYPGSKPTHFLVPYDILLALLTITDTAQSP
jgi:hypothetical protein